MGKKEESTMLKRRTLKKLFIAALFGVGFAVTAPSPVQAGNSLSLSIGSHGRIGVTTVHSYGSRHGHRSHVRRHYRPHHRPSYRHGHGASIAVVFDAGAFGYERHDSYPYTAKHTVRYMPINRLVAGVRAGRFACYHHITHRHFTKRYRLNPRRLKHLYATGHGDAIRCHATY
jgi:hypothetical protein